MLKQTLVSELSSIDQIGQVMNAGIVLDQTTGADQVITVPKGQVFLITHILAQAETLTSGVANFTPQDQQIASPDLGVYGITFLDADGTQQNEISFLAFRRAQSVFEVQDSPNWRNAPPGNIVLWRPKYPIPVPAGWTVKNTAGGEYGNCACVYGIFVGETAAATAGYRVSSSVTDANRRYAVNSGSTTTSFADLAPARTGYCIRILDINVRIQPRTGGATNRVDLAQTDGRLIFSWTNNNPSDLLERSISPEIFLKSGQALQIKGSIASTASVNVSYEYVAENEVPGDMWWACIEPELATPSSTKVGFTALDFSNLPIKSTEVTCFYPRPSQVTGSDVTKTSPTTGYQHILRGYEFSIQKTTSVRPDQTAVCISTGSAAGQIALPSAQTNVQLSPTFLAVHHDQCVYGGVADLVLPCKKDDGSIWIDSITLPAANQPLSVLLSTPATTDADIDEWAFTLWGKTIPTKFGNPSNRGL